MSTIRKRTITFRKSIRDKGYGEYGTPCTAQLTEFIDVFCTNHSINVIELNIRDPFKDSYISINGTKEDLDKLFAYLKDFENQFILTNVTIN